MKEDSRGITFEEIEKIASGMLSQGVKPTVRGVISVSGGKTEVVSKHLRDFFEKRDVEVSKMANEIGSGAIAKLIASEIHSIVNIRTSELLEVNTRQKEQINELVELLEEKVAESETIKKDSIEAVELAKSEAAQKIEKITLDASNKIKIAQNDKESAIEAKHLAERSNAETKLLSENSIEASKEKSRALIEAANKKTQQAEQETKILREQVKSLSIDEAKRDIEKAEFEKTKQMLEELRLEYAEQKAIVVQTAAENKALERDALRLETDNKDYRLIDKELTKSQVQLIEAQKTITELSNKLSLSERERESLSSALSRDKS